jgi:hypothetical protein
MGGEQIAGGKVEVSYARVAVRSALILILIPVIALLLLSVRLPAPIAAWMFKENAGGLLYYADRSPAPLTIAMRRAMGMWLEHDLARRIYAAQSTNAGLDDVRRLASRLVELKPLLISQTEVPHRPLLAEVGTAGLGWCDQINAFAGIVLASDFARPEVVGLSDPVTRQAHSVGRVWSDDRNGWLYFDVWSDEVVVFTDEPEEPAKILFGAFPTERRAMGTEQLRHMYDIADTGFTLYKAQPTAAQHALYVARNLLVNGTRLPDGAQQGIARDRSITGPSNYPPSSAPEIFTSASAAYAAARLQHIAGDRSGARRAYMAVIEQDRYSVYGLASKVFLGRMDRQRSR